MASIAYSCSIAPLGIGTQQNNSFQKSQMAMAALYGIDHMCNSFIL
jgi:hypothetical protein